MLNMSRLKLKANLLRIDRKGKGPHVSPLSTPIYSERSALLFRFIPDWSTLTTSRSGTRSKVKLTPFGATWRQISAPSGDGAARLIKQGPDVGETSVEELDCSTVLCNQGGK